MTTTTAHELSRAGVAFKLGLSVEAVDARIRNGQLKAFRRGHVFIRLEDVERAAAAVPWTTPSRRYAAIPATEDGTRSVAPVPQAAAKEGL